MTKLKIYNFRNAIELLQNEQIFDKIINLVSSCPIPVLSNKSDKASNDDVVQQFINRYFHCIFTENDWKAEKLATPKTQNDLLKSDFWKEFTLNKTKLNTKYNLVNSDDNKTIKVQIEVELGNVASTYRNYFKFLLSFSHGVADVGVMIVPTKNLAKRMTTGVANFERILRELPQSKLILNMPLLIIGIENDKDSEIDLSKYGINSQNKGKKERLDKIIKNNFI